LAGDFTDWQEHPIPMHEAADGVWSADVRLAPGAHRYRFLVDGEWRDDPECNALVANPFGTRDAVRQVA
jgi:1,4-alpha-glucan branching enzyme